VAPWRRKRAASPELKVLRDFSGSCEFEKRKTAEREPYHLCCDFHLRVDRNRPPERLHPRKTDLHMVAPNGAVLMLSRRMRRRSVATRGKRFLPLMLHSRTEPRALHPAHGRAKGYGFSVLFNFSLDCAETEREPRFPIVTSARVGNGPCARVIIFGRTEGSGISALRQRGREAKSTELLSRRHGRKDSKEAKSLGQRGTEAKRQKGTYIYFYQVGARLQTAIAERGPYHRCCSPRRLQPTTRSGRNLARRTCTWSLRMAEF
jgi:hypothetical protein